MSKPYKRKDHLYRLAKDEGFRSRASYKLIELNRRYKLLRGGMRVADLGCYPGGWLQVALEAVGPEGLLVGIDLRETPPVSHSKAQAVIIKGDFLDSTVQEQISSLAPGKFDLVLSDLSPQLSGIKIRDAVRSVELLQSALDFCGKALKQGGGFVAKGFPSAELEQFAKEMRPLFGSFLRTCLDSTRSSSNELYFVGRDFKR